MSIDELTNAVGENKLGFRKIGAAVNVSLEMDDKTLDYYYNINVKELLNSDMPLNDLDDLKEEGWAFDETKRNLRIFISH